MPARLIGIAPGDPFAVPTFSGSSRGLLSALDRRGALAAAVDGRPTWLERLELAASVETDRDRWRQSYYAGGSAAGPALRELTSRLATRRAKAAAGRVHADATLQITGWFRAQVPGLRSASFHDGNLATTLRRPDLLIDRGSRRIRRALAWERGLYDATDRIFTMSEWLRQSFIEDFGQAPDKVVVAGGGTDLELPEESDHEWEVPRLLFVGREWERKGGPDLLAAWPLVRARLPEAQLILVGPAAPPPALPPGVDFRGRIDRSTPAGAQAFAAAYRDATAFVLPSVYEPFGLVLLEAMAHGLPCVAADRCAMPEIVDHGRTGLVADAGDPEALAGALVAVLDPATARTMGAAGRERMVAGFTWDAVAGRILDAL